MTDYADSLTPQTTAKAARAKVEPKLKAVASSAHDAYDSLKEVASEAVDETRARVKDIAAQASDEIQTRYGDLEAWARLKPARALGIAAGLGVVLGLLLRGRSTKTIYVREPR
ncbi:DUF883 family protein [Caulobacter sp. 602-1]|uniref:DUF883 family protein n=1 Tax=unclassified Caulobacter TaxID=2648921 RepID=UPI000F634CB2|nr:DUF883 family protein [Caulobacter sp. 602-1]RRN62298.1 DUF883 family protein [Caulobacter sp. 602-1]